MRALSAMLLAVSATMMMGMSGSMCVLLVFAGLVPVDGDDDFDQIAEGVHVLFLVLFLVLFQSV